MRRIINAELEEDKLNGLIKNQITTDESKANGLSAINNARLAKRLEVGAAGLAFPDVPRPEDVFDPAFLPSEYICKLLA